MFKEFFAENVKYIFIQNTKTACVTQFNKKDVYVTEQFFKRNRQMFLHKIFDQMYYFRIITVFFFK